MNKLLSLVRPVQELTGDRFTFIVAGPSGTGKSWLLGDMAMHHKTLLIATLARESASWKYREANVDVVPLWEDGFYAPKADGVLPPDVLVEGASKFLDLVKELRDDDTYDAIALDSGTELAELFWHQAMLPNGVVSPAFITDKRSRWLPYDTLGTNLDQGVKGLVSLSSAVGVKRPKYVGISWHVQPPKDDTVESVGDGQNTVRVTKESADNRGEGVEYEGKVLPMIRGGFRRKLSSQADAFIFTDIKYENRTEGMNRYKVPKYVLQVQPDEERHARVPGPLPNTKYIPNSFAELSKVVSEGKVAVAAEKVAKNAASPSTGAARSPFRTPTQKKE